MPEGRCPSPVASACHAHTPPTREGHFYGSPFVRLGGGHSRHHALLKLSTACSSAWCPSFSISHGHQVPRNFSSCLIINSLDRAVPLFGYQSEISCSINLRIFPLIDIELYSAELIYTSFLWVFVINNMLFIIKFTNEINSLISDKMKILNMK